MALTPRPVICLTDHLRRDLEVARGACAGRFTHFGVTLELGRPPDWCHPGLARDEEWRIEWTKLYEGLDLAHTFLLTGDTDCLATWQDLVQTYCDQVEVGADSSDVAARRMQNWLYAWQRFSALGPVAIRPGLADRLVARLLAEADHLAEHLTPERNHRTLELYTLLLVGLALGPDLDNARGALELLAENAVTDVGDDGVHRECSTDYHLIVLRSFVGAIANACQAGLAVPGALLDRTGRACDFALHVQRPDGTTPALSDGDQSDFRSLLAFAGELLDRPDLTWAGTDGSQGHPPEACLVTFPHGGYCTQRSGWGDGRRPYAEERFAVIDCGPIGDGGHGHYDQLSMEMFGGGRPLVVDPGRYTYAEHAGWRRWFKGTAAHNTVCVDSLDQTPYRRGKPKGPMSVARLLARHTEPGLDIVMAEVRSPSYQAVHTRLAAFVDNDYWLVHDQLRSEGCHRFEARWHLAPEAWGRTTVDTDGEQCSVQGPGVMLVVPRWCGALTVEAGWVSPTYGVKHRAPVVVVAVDGHTDVDIVTAVFPGEGPRRLSAERTTDVLITEVRHGRGRPDRVWWRPGPPLEAARVQSRW